MNRPIKKTKDTESKYVMQELDLGDLEKISGGTGKENEIKERFSFKPIKNVLLSCIHVIKNLTDPSCV